MTALSPPLFLAGLHQFVDAQALDPAGDLTLYWTGTQRPDLEFIHRVGQASHRDPVCGVTAWPLTVCDSPSSLVAFAERFALRSVLALPGDLVVLSSDDALYPSAVGVVARVEEYASDRKTGPTRCDLMLAEAVEDEPRRMRLARLRRWCGATRGDVVIRWADLRGQAAQGRAA